MKSKKNEKNVVIDTPMLKPFFLVITIFFFGVNLKIRKMGKI